MAAVEEITYEVEAEQQPPRGIDLGAETTAANGISLSRIPLNEAKLQFVNPVENKLLWLGLSALDGWLDERDGKRARHDGPSPLGDFVDFTVDHYVWLRNLSKIVKHGNLSSRWKKAAAVRDIGVDLVRYSHLIVDTYGEHEQELESSRKNALAMGNERFSFLATNRLMKVLYQGLKTTSIAMLSISPSWSTRFAKASIAVGYARAVPVATDPESYRVVGEAAGIIGRKVKNGIVNLWQNRSHH